MVTGAKKTITGLGRLLEWDYWKSLSNEKGMRWIVVQWRNFVEHSYIFVQVRSQTVKNFKHSFGKTDWSEYKTENRMIRRQKRPNHISNPEADK